MKIIRTLIAILILSAGTYMLIWLANHHIQTPLKSSFVPLLQVGGKSTKAINQVLLQVMPVNDLDEAQYGEVIRLRYRELNENHPEEAQYVNQLLDSLAKHTKKPFGYEAFVLDYEFPNAYALPGGAICVTHGLLNTLESEAELASVLAHEIGHIELGHCMDAVKYELLFKKIKTEQIGKLADFGVNLLLRHTYQKNQETEADEYAYQMIQLTQYDPSAVASAFERLEALSMPHGKESAGILKDYQKTHPPIPLRIEKFSEIAKVWWAANPDSVKYVGIQNLDERISKDSVAFEGEWVGNGRF